MKSYENKYRDAAFICGIDEVGRGPLAGPVVAGAVILPKDSQILYLNDSKKLTEKRREELYEVIMREAVAVGIGIVSPARIDEINILQATYEAMREAVGKLCVEPNVLLNDAVTNSDDPSAYCSGAHHQRRCQKCFNCRGKYCGEGDKRPADDRI